MTQILGEPLVRRLYRSTGCIRAVESCHTAIGLADTAVVKYKHWLASYQLTRALLSPSVWMFVAPVMMITIVVLFGQSWLTPGLPMGDLGGTVADMGRWQQYWETGTLFAPWDDAIFLGHPRALLNLTSFVALLYLPFLYLGGPVLAIKLGTLVYLGLGGFTACLLMRRLTGKVWVGLLLGAAYALHPVHLSAAIATSHPNFPPFYAIQPLVVLALLRMLRRPDWLAIACLALIGSLALVIDLERVLVFIPALGALAIVLMWTRLVGSNATFAQARRWIGWRVAGVLLAGGVLVLLLASLWLPALADQSLHAMFDSQSLRSSVDFFSVRNPLYYFDRNGYWLSQTYQQLPAEFSHDAGRFYLGLGVLSLAVAGVVWRGYAGRRTSGLAVAGLVAAAVSVTSAHGPFNALESLERVLDYVFLYETNRRTAGYELMIFVAGIVLWFLGIICVSSMLAPKRRLVARLILVAVMVGVTLVARPYGWILQYLPVYDGMRNPGWFMTAGPPLGLLIAASVACGALPKAVRSPSLRIMVIAGLVLVLGWDAFAYRAVFDNQMNAKAIEELAIIGQTLKTDHRDGAVMARETYNPHSDIVSYYSGRPMAWYYLNWAAPKATSHLFLDEIYPRLHRPETIDQAMHIAGQANVRFILYDLTEGPLPPANNTLKSVWQGEYFSLYENRACRPTARLRRQTLDGRIIETSVGWKETRPGQFQFSVPDTQHEARLVFARAWMPRWRAFANGQSVEVGVVENALTAIPVKPGTKHIQLQWGRNTAHTMGLGASCVGIVSIIVILGLFGIERNAQRRGQLSKGGQ